MALNFQDLILNLSRFWSDYGCIIQQPYDIEKGASTMNPATFLRALGPEPWSTAMVEPCRRPTDARYGENPNRLGQCSGIIFKEFGSYGNRFIQT